MCPAHRDLPTPTHPHSRLNFPHPIPSHTYNGLKIFHSQQPLRPFSSIGSTFRIQYRSIQTQVNKTPTLHNQALKKSPRGVQRGRGFAAPLRFSYFRKILRPFANPNETQYFQKYFFTFCYLTTRTLYMPSISLSSSNALADAALSRSIRV